MAKFVTRDLPVGFQHGWSENLGVSNPWSLSGDLIFTRNTYNAFVLALIEKTCQAPLNLSYDLYRNQESQLILIDEFVDTVQVKSYFFWLYRRIWSLWNDNQWLKPDKFSESVISGGDFWDDVKSDWILDDQDLISYIGQSAYNKIKFISTSDSIRNYEDPDLLNAAGKILGLCRYVVDEVSSTFRPLEESAPDATGIPIAQDTSTFIPTNPLIGDSYYALQDIVGTTYGVEYSWTKGNIYTWVDVSPESRKYGEPVTRVWQETPLSTGSLFWSGGTIRERDSSSSSGFIDYEAQPNVQYNDTSTLIRADSINFKINAYTDPVQDGIQEPTAPFTAEELWNDLKESITYDENESRLTLQMNYQVSRSSWTKSFSEKYIDDVLQYTREEDRLSGSIGGVANGGVIQRLSTDITGNPIKGETLFQTSVDSNYDLTLTQDGDNNGNFSEERTVEKFFEAYPFVGVNSSGEWEPEDRQQIYPIPILANLKSSGFTEFSVSLNEPNQHILSDSLDKFKTVEEPPLPDVDRYFNYTTEQEFDVRIAPTGPRTSGSSRFRDRPVFYSVNLPDSKYYIEAVPPLFEGE